MTYFLDTCILSEYVKKKPNLNVIEWLDDQDEHDLFVSILTIGELKKGIIKLEISAPERYKKLCVWLEKVELRFEGRILPLSREVISTWAELCGRSEAKGKKLPVIDSLIAATAQEYDKLFWILDWRFWIKNKPLAFKQGIIQN